jgi:hypothetical protein
VKKKDPRLIIVRIPVKNDEFFVVEGACSGDKEMAQVRQYYTVEVYSKIQL